jgi:ankyrin repeat protein
MQTNSPLGSASTLTSLPVEVLMHIMSHMSIKELALFSQTRSEIWLLANDNVLWKTLYHKHFPESAAALKKKPDNEAEPINYKNQFKHALKQYYPNKSMKPALKKSFECARTGAAFGRLLEDITLADLTVQDGSELTLIHCARGLQRKALLEAIFQRIQDIYREIDNRSSLLSFLSQDDPTPLAERKDESGNTLLIWAVDCDALEWIEKMDKAFLASINVANNAGATPLHVACLNNNTNIAQWLSAHKADWLARTKLDNTPLHIIATYHALEPFLTSLGISHENIGDQYQTSRTLLHAAAIGKRADNIKFLLEHGAKVNAKSNGDTPPIDSRDYDAYLSEEKLTQWSALHFAAWKGDIETVKHLVEHGANLTDQCLLNHPAHARFCFFSSTASRSVTSLQLAQGHKEVTEYLSHCQESTKALSTNRMI